MSRSATYFALALAFFGSAIFAYGDAHEFYMKWAVHDTQRPIPKQIDPGFTGTQDKPGKAPSDAIVLFDGTSTDAFQTDEGKPVAWPIVDGVMVVQWHNIYTKRRFRDVQLHVEWMIPGLGEQKTGLNAGNSGIYLMDRYEVQVINNKTPGMYADGMTGSIYGQFPPLANPSKGQNQWQSYDIIFRAPRFDETGELLEPAYMTILHNGVLVQNHQELMGPTVWSARTKYEKHDDKLPISLQYHSSHVHYRNIWVRELSENAVGG